MLHAPANKGIKWDWASRREAILSRPDNVLTWAQPLGFAAAFAAAEHRAEHDWLAKMSEQQELAYLIATQDQDLAPEWRVLMENGIEAFSKDGSSSSPDADDADITIELMDESDTEPTIYVRPSRRELWWMEEDHYRWMCGPIAHAEYYQKPDGGRGIRTVGRTGLTPEQETAWLQSIIEFDKAREAKGDTGRPDPALIEATRRDIKGRIEFYGSGWRMSLLTPEEQDALPHMQVLNKWLDILDSDAGRDALQAEDDLANWQAGRPGYAGGGELGTTVWEGISDLSFWQELDHQTESAPASS